MYKIRSRFYKKGDMVFISHLDLVRVLERAFRRANIPMAYTQGYNPHPIMAFATALGVGISSEGEYIDIEVEKEIPLEDFMGRLNQALPEGLKIITSKYISKKAESLMSVINYSIYLVKLPFTEEVGVEELKNRLEEFTKLEEIIQVKEQKKKHRFKQPKTKEVNIRNSIVDIEIVQVEEKEAILKMTLAAGSNGNLKPEIVVEKFKEINGMPIELQEVRVQRLELLTDLNPQHLTPLDIDV
ncbi:MAG: DUF2344 domain-containing protein [Clostridiaceae bacterium]|nr:DUF2344 domain-containing protein [Clostridiaceae bacterium]